MSDAEHPKYWEVQLPRGCCLHDGALVLSRSSPFEQTSHCDVFAEGSR
jgi:hypothetical protein